MYIKYGKRLLDISIAISALFLLLPLLAFVSVSVVLDSGMPILFRQRRVGRFGNLFTIYKFRTMKKRDRIGESGFSPGDKQRVTRVGKVLRKSKLDELPQLFNVLIGQMSIVGPRPEVPCYVDAHDPIWGQVLSVRPGITDNASVYYSNEEELLAGAKEPSQLYREVVLPQKLQMCIEYANNVSMERDIRLIFDTLRKLFGRLA